jgi:PHP family Zn ribbon phosphoesterase
MLPPLIVQEALDRGIQVIAITDHNATGNIQAVQQAAAGSGLIVLPGMELQTREEVHVLCLFDSLEQAYALQASVDAHLPNIANDPEHFGMQLLVDGEGEFLRQEERLLLASTELSLEQAFALVSQLGGLFIPAHVNRKAYGLIEVLGFLPPDLPVELVEISRHLKPEEAPLRLPQIRGIPLIQNGDVHRLEEFMGVTHLHMGSPSIAEIRMAVRGEEGRSMRIL